MSPVDILQEGSARAAQEIPCPYGALAYFYNNELLTYPPAGTMKLLELLEPRLTSKTRLQ